MSVFFIVLVKQMLILRLGNLGSVKLNSSLRTVIKLQHGNILTMKNGSAKMCSGSLNG